MDTFPVLTNKSRAFARNRFGQVASLARRRKVHGKNRRVEIVGGMDPMGAMAVRAANDAFFPQLPTSQGVDAGLKFPTGLVMAGLTFDGLKRGWMRKFLDPGQVSVAIDAGKTGLAMDRAFKGLPVHINLFPGLAHERFIAMANLALLAGLTEKEGSQPRPEQNQRKGNNTGALFQPVHRLSNLSCCARA